MSLHPAPGTCGGLALHAITLATVAPLLACQSEPANTPLPASQNITFPDPTIEAIYAPVGTDLAALVADHPSSTHFRIGSGVHLEQEIVPKDGNVFVGDPGAVLDGNGVVEFAFRGGYGIDDVTIDGLEIRNYAPPPQWAAVRGVDTRNWIVIRNDIHDNTGGVRIGPRMRVIANRIHHNHQTGIMGQGDYALIQGNEVDHNNHDLQYDPEDYPETFEAGGMKITYSRGITIRDNFVHHNGVTGIWMDIDNIDVVIENNQVEDNLHHGIYYEISYAGTIRDNLVRRNGFAGGWYHRGGIIISSSSDVEVTANRLFDNGMGIIGSQNERGSGAHGPHWLQNLDVHHNIIDQTQGVIGVVHGPSVGGEVFNRNNRFSTNTYTLGPETRYFRWMQQDLTQEEWVAYGHDVDGVFHRLADDVR